MGLAQEDFDKGGTVVEAIIDEKQIALPEVADELQDELVFRCTHLPKNKAQGGTGEHIEKTAKLHGNRPQSLAALVCTEVFP